MSYKSRMGALRENSTVTVYTQTRTSSQYADSVVDTGLFARKEDSFTQELVTDAGLIVVISQVFWFDRKDDGTFPAIEEKHVLYDGTDRFEVMQVIQRRLTNRLKVMTRVLR